MKIRLLLTAMLGIFICFSVFSQKYDGFKPDLWLYNFQTKEDLRATPQLNFKKGLFSNRSRIQSSSKKMNKTNHLFIVFKSEGDEQLLSFLGKNNALFVDGSKMFLRDSISTAGYNQPYGELVDIRFSNIEEGKLWINNNLKQSVIYEVVLVDGARYRSETDAIRTYLGLKYGIDLIDYKHYTYKGHALWEGKNKKFNHRIIGIGHFNYFNLFQYKSTHSKDQDLILSFTREAASRLKDGEYVLAGNNTKPFEFDRKTGVNKKEWLVQTNKEATAVDISLPLRLFSGDRLQQYELEVEGNGHKIPYAGQLTDSLLVFKGIYLSKDDSYLVRLKQTASAIGFDFVTDCEKNELKLDIPDQKIKDFRLKITDSKQQEVLTTTEVKKTYSLSHAETAYFDIEIQYNTKTFKKRVETFQNSLAAENIKPVYYLGETGLTLEIPEDKNRNIKRKWQKEGSIIEEGNRLVVHEEGRYSLESYNDNGCFVQQAFTVIQPDNKEEWTVYPNPAKESEPVTAWFRLASESEVTIEIYLNNGKHIKTIYGGTLKQKEVMLGTLGAGTYMVVAYIDKTPQIKKIIIK